MLANDSILPDSNESLALGAVGIPNQGGTVTITADSKILYTPALTASASELFTYTVRDSNGGVAQAWVAILFLVDHDKDGIPDYLDLEDDGSTSGDGDRDGLLDQIECNSGIPCIDTDHDGKADYMDADDDNDGVPTSSNNALSEEGVADQDGDGIPNYLDPVSGSAGGGDSDGDGISDADECANGIPCSDSNKNRVPDYMENLDRPMKCFLPLVVR